MKIASASYCWSRVASALGLLSQYSIGELTETWHMLVADDHFLEPGGEDNTSALIVFLIICSVSGIPLSWIETAGGGISSPGWAVNSSKRS